MGRKRREIQVLMADNGEPTVQNVAASDSFNGLWREGYWWSQDELRLHYRDYPGPEGANDKLPMVCMPGLTRNARDFEAIAEHVSKSRRVISVDFRGRGESAYAKNPMTYVPLTYAQDMMLLFQETGISRYVACGTSLGGIVTMLLAVMNGDRLAGAILNDVGPVIEEAGIERIKSYVGQGGNQPTWVHAARAAQELHGETFPEWTLDDWLRMVKCSHKITKEGRIVPDYDSKIMEPIRVADSEAEIDLWPALVALNDRPTLILRGAISDILSPATAEMMVEKLQDATLVTVPNVGHAPILSEPVAVDAIDALLAKADKVEAKRETAA